MRTGYEYRSCKPEMKTNKEVVRTNLKYVGSRTRIYKGERES